MRRHPGVTDRRPTANKLIRTLIILACVICGDETPVRVGPGPAPEDLRPAHLRTERIRSSDAERVTAIFRATSPIAKAEAAAELLGEKLKI
jgi:hypothetical protein